MALTLEGKVAVITGAASGIGLATVELFVAQGARVIAADRQVERGQALADRFPGQVRFEACDVTRCAELKRAIDAAASHFGGLDILFSNAGAGGTPAGVEAFDEAAWDATQALLLRSVAFRNKSGGIDQNNNTAGQTVDNNTSWGNYGKNINLFHNSTNAPMTGSHVVRNNLSFNGGSPDSFWPGTIFTNNSWQVLTNPVVSASDVLSVNTSVATAPRNADGSLPYWPFLRPVPAGRLIDKGVILSEPFTGASPDLGAFEDGL